VKDLTQISTDRTGQKQAKTKRNGGYFPFGKLRVRMKTENKPKQEQGQKQIPTG
jgi:hypothetical protein